MNIKGLKDIRDKNREEDEEEEENERRQREKYVGGESSGQNVLDPRMKKLIEKLQKEEKAETDTFKGKGVALGGQNVSNTDPKRQISLSELMNSEFTSRSGQPAYELQLRFSNGEKKIIKVSEETKISDVHDFIAKKLKAGTFKMLAFFPKKDITLSTTTLKEMDLLNSSIDILI